MEVERGRIWKGVVYPAGCLALLSPRIAAFAFTSPLLSVASRVGKSRPQSEQAPASCVYLALGREPEMNGVEGGRSARKL